MEENTFTNGNYVLVLFWRKNQVLIEEKTLQKKFRKHFRTLQNISSEKNCYIWGRAIRYSCIGGMLFIKEECGNLKVFVDGGELIRNINDRKRPDVLQVYVCPICNKYHRLVCFFNKHVEFCESLM